MHGTLGGLGTPMRVHTRLFDKPNPIAISAVCFFLVVSFDFNVFVSTLIAFALSLF